MRPSPPLSGSSISGNLAGNQRIFVERVNGAKAVIAVGDDDLAIGGVSHEQDRREFLPGADFIAVSFYVKIAGAQQREPRGAEDILGLELRDLGRLQAGNQPAGSLVIVDEIEIGLRRRVIVLVRGGQPSDFYGAAHARNYAWTGVFCRAGSG